VGPDEGGRPDVAADPLKRVRQCRTPSFDERTDDATRFDFGDAPVRVEIYPSEETAEIFIVEADFEKLPEERRRFALLNIPRHLFSEATAVATRLPRSSTLHPQWPRNLDTQLIPGLVRSPISYPRTLCSVPKNSPMVAIQQIRVVHHGCLPAIGVRYDLHSGSFGTIQLGSSAYHENRLRGQASLHIDEASGSE
jgi:hypothetical protein